MRIQFCEVLNSATKNMIIMIMYSLLIESVKKPRGERKLLLNYYGLVDIEILFSIYVLLYRFTSNTKLALGNCIG